VRGFREIPSTKHGDACEVYATLSFGAFATSFLGASCGQVFLAVAVVTSHDVSVAVARVSVAAETFAGGV
jgi:hypothetical protein